MALSDQSLPGMMYWRWSRSGCSLDQSPPHRAGEVGQGGRESSLISSWRTLISSWPSKALASCTEGGVVTLLSYICTGGGVVHGTQAPSGIRRGAESGGGMSAPPPVTHPSVRLACIPLPHRALPCVVRGQAGPGGYLSSPLWLPFLDPSLTPLCCIPFDLGVCGYLSYTSFNFGRRCWGT